MYEKNLRKFKASYKFPIVGHSVDLNSRRRLPIREKLAGEFSLKKGRKKKGKKRRPKGERRNKQTIPIGGKA